jgi:hypothetical protein
MRHNEPGRRTAKSSYIHALLLVLVLIVGYLGYSILIRGGGLLSGLTSIMSSDGGTFRQLESMAEDKKVALQRSFKGFWVYKTEDTTAPVQKTEWLELQESGIIWQVTHWRVAYPTGDTGSYYRVFTAYLRPYSVAENGRSIVCEVRTIRQTYLYDNDTCFGKSQVDELWETWKDDTVLVMNRKRYTPYHGELAEFFPDSMIDLVDKLLLNECTHEMSLTYLIRTRLQELYQNNPKTGSCDTTVFHGNIQRYFKPVYLDELFATIPYFPEMKGELVLPIILKHDGTVSLDLTKSERVQAEHVESLIYKTLETWPFPRCDGTSTPEITDKLVFPPR